MVENNPDLAGSQAIMKTMKGNRLRIYLGTDYPIRIDWTGPTTRGTWLCAPRIEAE